MTGRMREGSAPSGERKIRAGLAFFLFLIPVGCALIALQTTLFSRLSFPFLPFRTEAAPSLCLLFIMAVGFLGGKEAGGVAGLLLGWLCDSTGGPGFMILPLVYFPVGYAVGWMSRRRLAHNLPSFLVFAAVGALAEAVCTAAGMLMHRIPLSAVFRSGIPTRFLLTVLSAVPVYALTRLFFRRDAGGRKAKPPKPPV